MKIRIENITSALSTLTVYVICKRDPSFIKVKLYIKLSDNSILKHVYRVYKTDFQIAKEMFGECPNRDVCNEEFIETCDNMDSCLDLMNHGP